MLENDAKCALFAECWCGAARGATNVGMMTLGTGVGGGFMVDGRVLRGATGSAGEIGHTIVHPNGRLEKGTNVHGALQARACFAASPSELQSFLERSVF